MTYRTIFAVLLATAAASPTQARGGDPADLVIANVTVIDPETRTVRAGQDIVVDDGRIVAIARTGTRARPATRTIDGSGKFAIPGLMDMHIHANLRPLHKSTLALMHANGITGARDMAGDCHSEKGIAMCIGEMRTAAAAIDAGTLTGPRLLALSTMKIQSQGAPKDPADPRARFFPQNPEQTAALIPVLLARKPDIVKMGDTIDTASYKLLIDAAKAARIEVSGHIPAQLSVAQAAAMRRHGTYYVPTHLTRQMDYRASDPSYRNDPRMAWIVPQQRQMWERDLDKYAGMTAEQIDSFGKFFRLGLALTGRAHKAGVKIMAGTDTNDTMVFPGFSLHDELALLVEAGLSPMDALRAATTVPADYLRRTKDFGGLSKGKLADLVLLDADPVEAIGNSTRIAYVIQGGRVSDRAALDAILTQMRAPAPAK